MKEIKFRAWVPEEDGFAYSDACRGYWFIMSKIGGLAFVDRTDRELPTMDWQQFTGIRDKNDKEIYEGDTVTAADSNLSYIGSIIFHRGCFVIYRYKYPRYAPLDGWDLEVIGNIYENPELIESD